eukprot:TRINITY_DN23272_c0_g1_i1.p1 TRINITY_DN23272_c0_g1~~TRINITY_DN23272_c0_g1_i1.p1  ORF type:complete len:173 (-),score=27.87 TRINITY_DN23272_c0_g1_i1:54-572(-)
MLACGWHSLKGGGGRSVVGVHRRGYCNPHANPNKNLKQIQQSAIGVYLELLKHATKWPLEEGREDRSLKHPLVKRLEEEISTIEQATDVRDVMKLGTKAQKDLDAIISLLRNKSFKEYRLKEYRVPEVVNQEKKLLSSATQKKIDKRKWGKLDRFLAWYLSEKPKDPSKPQE